MAVLGPAAGAFAERTAAEPHPFELGPEEGRRAIERHQAVRVRRAAVTCEDLTVPGGPLGDVPVRVVRPSGARGPLPVVLYIHGAGWVFGSVTIFERLLGDLVAGTGAALVFPGYSRAPRARYPVAIEECYAVAAWVAERGDENRLDSARLAVVGDSVGANMATVVALLAKERGGPRLRRQVLFYPATDAAFETASYREFATGHWLRRDAMQWFWDQYAGAAERAEITVSPLRANLDQLAGLPPALVITAEADVLRDEGEAYAARLRQAGVPVTAVRYQGTIHDFVMLNALADSDEARAAIGQASAVLRGALAVT
jgi:acetyl esterase/lipase